MMPKAFVMPRIIQLLLIMLVLFNCEQKNTSPSSRANNANLKEQRINKTSIIVLGTTQDAGAPQIGCKKKCCTNLFSTQTLKKNVVSLGLVDIENNKTYLFEATPDIGNQIELLQNLTSNKSDNLVDGIFITHAHIGHYTGLMYLGKEATNADKIPTYTMPRMTSFLETNGPWSQLVENENIALHTLEDNNSVSLSNTIKITPFLVPHRDEFSETVGYKIQGPNKLALFIPDIDKWEKWEQGIAANIKRVDYAFLDATFFNGKEINNRDISEIPHPFVIESLKKFENLSLKDKNKIVFIHFNHTNPLLNPESKESKLVLKSGFKIARQLDVFEL